jgi:hypothetical protein
MKDSQINLKVSNEEKQLLKKAARRLHLETGDKPNVSKAIRQSIKEYSEKPIINDEPELFMCDRLSIRQVDNNIIYCQLYLQKFYEEFKTVTSCNLSFDELANLFEGLGKFGSESILHRDIAGMVTSKLYEKLVASHPEMNITAENLKIPDLTNLFEITEKLDNSPEVQNRWCGVYFSCYKLNDEKIEIIPQEVERLKDGYRKFASSAEQKQKLNHVRQLCNILNSFLSDDDVVPENLISVFYYDPESKRFEPSGNYITTSLKPNMLFERYH